MKKLIAIAAVIGLGIAGFAGTCNLLNPSLTQIGSNDTYAAQLQNSTGGNFLTHSFKVAFVDANGNLVDTKTGVPGCLRSWQNGASDFFSVQSSVAAASTTNAIGSLDLGSTLTAGTTVPGSIQFSNLKQIRKVTQLTVSGTIKNLDSDALIAPAVCAVVYDNNGKVIITGKASTGDLVANSGSATFTITLTVPDNTSTINRVDLWADGLNGGVPITPQSSTGHSVTNCGASTATPTVTNTPNPSNTATSTATATNTAVPTLTDTATPTGTTVPATATPVNICA